MPPRDTRCSQPSAIRKRSQTRWLTALGRLESGALPRADFFGNVQSHRAGRIPASGSHRAEPLAAALQDAINAARCADLLDVVEVLRQDGCALFPDGLQRPRVEAECLQDRRGDLLGLHGLVDYALAEKAG